VPQSLAKVLVHLIFSTKSREPLIHREVRVALHAYLAGTLKNLQCPSLQTGGTADHVHALVSLGRTRTIADVVEEMKKSSSKWMKQQGVQGFAWQAGYRAFSVSESQATAVIRYVSRQEEHHRQLTFQEEFRRFLDRYGVTYDERYMWD
jgi:REP-associated tyrosine transposase